MVYDIDIHELHLRPFIDLKSLDEISFQKCVFFEFLNNKCILISSFRKKTTTLSKLTRFYKWPLHYYYFSKKICLVMFHEPQTCMVVKNINYILCVHWFYPIQSSFSHWIKINFDSKWTLSLKMLSSKSLSLLLVFRIGKGYHQDCSLLRIIIFVIHHLFGWKVVHP